MVLQQPDSLLNPSKAKLMVFGSRQMNSRVVTPRLTFMGRYLVPEYIARDNTNLTYDEHITKSVSSCRYYTYEYGPAKVLQRSSSNSLTARAQKRKQKER